MVRLKGYFFYCAIITLLSCGKNQPYEPGSTTLPIKTHNKSSDINIATADEESAVVQLENLKKSWAKLKNETYKVNDVVYRYLTPDIEMAYCFASKDGKKIYSNHSATTGFEIASISKIFTSLWALNSQKQGNSLLPKRFVSDFYFNPETGTLYIDGSIDPMFGIDRLTDVLDRLNAQLAKNGVLVHKPLSSIVLSNFIQVPVYTYQGTYELYVRDTGINLATNDFLSKEYLRKSLILLQKNVHPLLLNIPLDELDIQRVTKAEILETISDQTSLIKITSVQRPLNHVLLYINTFSNNPGADLLFQMMGGSSKFFDFYRDYVPANLSSLITDNNADENQQYGYDKDVPFAFYSGSGLPNKSLLGPAAFEEEVASNLDEDQLQASSNVESRIKRNKASCQLIFQSIYGLEQTSIDSSIKVEELLSINGHGTLKKIISSSLPTRSFIGKTGSLRNLLTLAGLFKTDRGSRAFYLGFFRKNRADDGTVRNNAFNTNATNFVRANVTPELLVILQKYYQKKPMLYSPDKDLMAALVSNSFLATSTVINESL